MTYTLPGGLRSIVAVTESAARTRRDRCPGVLRPWIADDGALVRMRLIGGRTTRAQLLDLARIAGDHGDGNIYLTRRANLQIRGLQHGSGRLDPAVVEAVTDAGLLPSPEHELIRNVMVSPLTGRLGGRADLWSVADALDAGLLADPEFATLAGRFLFCLDDGRGDLADRSLDLGLVALDATHAQLRIGTEGWGPIVELRGAAEALLDLTRAFLAARGHGPNAWWHVDELPDRGASFAATRARDARTRVSADPPPYGTLEQDDGRPATHLAVPDGRLTSTAIAALPDAPLIITPWHSILATDLEENPAS